MQGAPTPTWRELLVDVRSALGDPDDASRILQRAAGRTGSDWVLGLDDRVPGRAVPFVSRMVERRAVGEPLQYVLGHWAFRHLDLLVDQRVLIPRPETEQVVDEVLGELTRLRIATGRAPVVADLGTGSGAIALSVAGEVAGAEVFATDASADALAVARANLAAMGGMAATRVRLALGSWYEALPPLHRGRIDLIVSNPPYVSAAEVPDLPPEVGRWEPMDALVPGPTGLEAIEQVVAGAPAWLARPGALVVEIAPSQAGPAVALALDAGASQAEVRPDLAGRLRTLVARFEPATTSAGG